MRRPPTSQGAANSRRGQRGRQDGKGDQGKPESFQRCGGGVAAPPTVQGGTTAETVRAVGAVGVPRSSVDPPIVKPR